MLVGMVADPEHRSDPSRTRQQARAFDQIGARYDEAFPHKDGQLVATDWVVEQLDAGDRVLDVGCGTGVPTAERLIAAGMAVTGIDISEEMLRLARTNVPEAEFRQRDLLDFAPSEGPFEGIVAFFALLMLRRDDIGPALTQLHGLLRDEGILALSMVEADLDDVPIPFLGSDIRVSGMSRDDLRAALADAGFVIDEMPVFSYNPASPDAPPEVQLFAYCRKAQHTSATVSRTRGAQVSHPDG